MSDMAHDVGRDNLDTDLVNWAPQILSQLAVAAPDAFAFEVLEDEKKTRVLRVDLGEFHVEAQYRLLEKSERQSLSDFLSPTQFTLSFGDPMRSFAVPYVEGGDRNSSYAYQLGHTILDRRNELRREAGQVMLDVFQEFLSEESDSEDRFHDDAAQIANVRQEDGDIKADIVFSYRLPKLDLSRFAATKDGVSLQAENSSLGPIHVSLVDRGEETRSQDSVRLGGTITMSQEENGRTCEMERSMKLTIDSAGASPWSTTTNAQSRVNSDANTLCRLLVSELNGRDDAVETITRQECLDKLGQLTRYSSPTLERYQQALEQSAKVLFAALESEPVDRSKLDEEDLVVYGKPVDEFIFSMSVFEIEALGDWQDQDAGDSVTMVVTETKGDDVNVTKATSVTETIPFRAIDVSLMPNGERGFMSFSSDGMTPICSLSLATSGAGDRSVEELAAFNKQENSLSLNFDNGRSEVALSTTDEGALAFSRGLFAGKSLEDLMKDVDHVESLTGEIGNFTLVRRLPDAVQASFALPGYFRIPKENAPVFSEIIEAYRALDNDDILSLQASKRTKG